MAQTIDRPPPPASPRTRAFQTLLALAFLYGCGSIASAAPAEEAAPIDVRTVESRSVPRALRSKGTLLAGREAHVAADDAGKIVGTFVERGEVVRKGEPLVRLDAREGVFAVGDAVIRAPFDGVVAERNVELGEHVVPGTRVATLVVER